MMSWLPRKRVLVAIDFSEASFHAVEAARSLATAPSDISLLHVLPEISPVEIGVVWGDVTEESRIQHAHAAMEELIAKHPEAEGITLAVRVGSTAKEVARHAEETGADLVIVGSHGHSYAHRMLVGSTAEQIVHLAHCPVLVLKAPSH